MQASTLKRNALLNSLPPALKPVLLAYSLGYASSTAPRLLTLLLTHLSKRRKATDDSPHNDFYYSFLHILKGGLQIQRFATFCAALVGGSSLLQACDPATLSG